MAFVLVEVEGELLKRAAEIAMRLELPVESVIWMAVLIGRPPYLPPDAIPK